MAFFIMYYNSNMKIKLIIFTKIRIVFFNVFEYIILILEFSLSLQFVIILYFILYKTQLIYST